MLKRLKFTARKKHDVMCNKRRKPLSQNIKMIAFTKIIALILLFLNCKLTTNVKIDESLRMKINSIEIDAGSSDIELFLRHAFIILELNKKFIIKKKVVYKQEVNEYGEEEEESTLIEILPKNAGAFMIDYNDIQDDRFLVLKLPDNKVSFKWTLSRRIIDFVPSDSEVKKLQINIQFPGEVLVSNGQLVEKNTYTWAFSEKELEKDVEIQALFFIPVAK